MKRALLATAAAALAALAWSPAATANTIAADDDAVCISLEPVIGYCQGNPVSTVQAILDLLPIAASRS